MAAPCSRVGAGPTLALNPLYPVPSIGAGPALALYPLYPVPRIGAGPALALYHRGLMQIWARDARQTYHMGYNVQISGPYTAVRLANGLARLYIEHDGPDPGFCRVDVPQQQRS